MHTSRHANEYNIVYVVVCLQVSMLTCMRMWVVSWCGNFAGCVIMVGLLYASGIYDHKDEYLVYIAEDKVTKCHGIFICSLSCSSHATLSTSFVWPCRSGMAGVLHWSRVSLPTGWLASLHGWPMQLR